MADFVDTLVGYLPKQSAGDTVAEGQAARAEGANTQNPEAYAGDLDIGFQAETIPTNAQEYTPNATTGVNAATRTSQQVQSLPGSTATPGSLSSVSNGTWGTVSDEAVATTGILGNGAGAKTFPGATAGAASNNDDNFGGLNPVAAKIEELYGNAFETVTPTPNILDRYASYTYNISLYLMTPQQYNRLLTSRRKSVAGMSLLISSAGAPSNRSTDPAGLESIFEAPPSTAEVGRSQFFPQDFYIDNVQLRTLINGKGTQGAHSATEVNFRIIEPNGITFIDNLAAATKQLALQTGDNANAYLGQTYLMVIRFYGYDQNGNLVKPTTESNANQSDRTAISEKFIPFIFTNIKFKIANRLSEYECQAICPQNMIATAQQRGVIPYNFQITASTLNELLAVDLAGALNGYQLDWVKQGIFTYADHYSFELAAPLNSSTVSVVPPGDTNLSQTGMGPAPNGDPRRLLPATQSVQKSSKSNSATAGVSIVQFIDQQVRNSGYILQQQTKIYNPKTGDEELQSGSGKRMAWYRIGVQASPRLDQWDPKRGDYAYNIVYRVTPYLVTDVLSDYFPRSPRWTAPKEYYHWYTGRNSQIIDYSQELNNLYYYVVSTAQPTVSQSVMKNLYKKGYQPVSPQSSQGMANKVYEPGANAAAYLYNPADFARVRMTIVGDPDWIQQGDVWEGISGKVFNSASASPFLPDGTINYEGREVLFDVIFNTPADYNYNQGIVQTGGTPGAQGVANIAQSLEMRNRYKAVWVTHNFAQGRFTQDIEGMLVVPEVADDRESGSILDNFINSLTANNSTKTSNNSGTPGGIFDDVNGVTQSTGTAYPESFQSTGELQNSTYTGTYDIPTTTPYSAPTAPTSGTQIVGQADSATAYTAANGLGFNNANYGTGGVSVTQVSVTVVLLTGSTTTVTSEAEINELYAAGEIDLATANNGINSIRSKIAAQQPAVTTSSAQLSIRDF